MNILDEQTMQRLENIAHIGEKKITKMDPQMLKISKPVQKLKIKEWKDTLSKCKKISSNGVRQEQGFNQGEQNQNNNRDFSMNSICLTQQKNILDEVSTKFSLNHNQRKAFNLVGGNVVKRYNGIAFA